jgi:ATP phosphoribosyltransferase/thymidylate kinase
MHGVFNITKVPNIVNCHNDPIIINEHTISFGESLLTSKSRYGFRYNELKDIIIDCGGLYVLRPNAQNGLPRLITDSDYKQFATNESFQIGICAGRPVKSAFKFLEAMNCNPTKLSNHERDMRLDSDDYIMLLGKIHKIKYCYIKAHDIPRMVNDKLIDAVVCYGDIWYNLNDANYDIKYVGNFRDELGNGETYISLVGQTGKKYKEYESLKIACEYFDGHRLLEPYLDEIGLGNTSIEYIHVAGKAESLIDSGIVDLAITVVQTGETLKTNELVNLQNLRRIYLNMWVKVDTIVNGKISKQTDFFLQTKDPKKLTEVVIEGIDGAGKSSLIRGISKCQEIHNVVFYDRHPSICQMTLKQQHEWKDTDIDNNERVKIIIIDAEPEDCWERIRDRDNIERFEHKDALRYYQLRYRELAAHYGLYVVNNDNCKLHATIDGVLDVIKGGLVYKLPIMKDITADKFDNMDLVVGGLSKEVHNYDHRFDISKYIPSVHSHKKQRAGIVDGTDFERQEVTRYLMYLMAIGGIGHVYWYVGSKGFILVEKFRDPPPVEVCVKRYHVGTHKHMYDSMQNFKSRKTNKLIVGERGLYDNLYVRFDWRNPNHKVISEPIDFLTDSHAQIFVNPLRKSGMSDDDIVSFLTKQFPDGIPLGDYPLAEDVADEFIDVHNSKQLVRNAFETLEYHFDKMDIVFKDVCFMPLVDGKKLYGEVSQDCGRYEHKDIDGMDDVSKDVWRSGGSSELVLEKWHKLTVIVREYTQQFISDWQNEIGLT